VAGAGKLALSQTATALLSRLKRHPGRSGDDRADGGFSLLEVVIAIGLFSIILVGTDLGAVVTMSSALTVREHSVATSLISATVSEVEALPFAAVQAGLDPTVDSLSADPNIGVVVNGGVTSYVLNTNGSPIATCGTTSPESPLVPHITTVTSGITYHVAVYPTVSSPSCSSNPQVVTLVVMVSWSSSSGAGNKVVGETAIAAP
jgi:prepilin-type N-terminal cleavage/methylation domain-containing protein